MFAAIVLASLCCLEDPKEITLWTNGAPNAPPKFEAEEIKNRGENGVVDRHIRNVHVPTLTIYKPTGDAPRKNAAVIVCPGGGYHILAIDKEGHDVAMWLASKGIVGVVLKYRLPRPNGHVYPPNTPLSDAQRAIRYVRSQAKELDIKENRLGILGFSAGGHLASTAATHFDGGKPSSDDPLDRVSCRPDFAVLVYPVTTFDPVVGHSGSAKNLCGDKATPELIEEYCNDKHVTKETPPTFLVHATDDPVKVENSLAFYSALRKANVSAEMHIFAKGGHGYGIRTDWQGEKNPPVSEWPKLCEKWLDRIVFAKK